MNSYELVLPAFEVGANETKVWFNKGGTLVTVWLRADGSGELIIDQADPAKLRGCRWDGPELSGR